MSRSYKKNPFCTDHKCGRNKKSKQLSNRTFRRYRLSEDIPAKPQHKKYSESYNICDYKWYMTRREAINWYNYKMEHEASYYFKKRYPTLRAWLNYWEKCHVRK